MNQIHFIILLKSVHMQSLDHVLSRPKFRSLPTLKVSMHVSCIGPKVPEYVYPKEDVPEYSSILVPNVDNVRTDFLMQTIMKQRKAVLLIGEQGTAKTVMIKVRF